MAKLFLSYAREDAAVATRLARALERAGHEVWWDRELHGGASFGAEIERQLQQCDVVIVLWSTAGLQSPWVRDEAAVGRDAGKLLPITMDGAEPPIGFRQFHALDLSGWRGAKPAVARVDAAVERLTSGEAAAFATPPRRAWPRFDFSAKWLVAALLVLAAAAGTFLWVRSGDRSTATVAIVPTAGASNQALSRDYAQAIATDMAAFLAARPNDASVLEPERTAEAAYRFNVSVAGQGPTVDASLFLLGRGQQRILWSRNWTEVDRASTDLKKQMSLLAAEAFSCALETQDSRPALRPSLVGPFIQGCIGEGLSNEELKDIFSRITREQPKFAAGWVELATAYGTLAFSYYAANERVPLELSKPGLEAIQTALRLNPRSGKAFLAQLPFVAKSVSQDMRLHERAVALEPDDARLHRELSSALRNVGRMRESIKHAKRAIELDPLSPATRAAYISALTYGGYFEQARQEIAKAERIWPNSNQILTADYGFNYRYGDPKRAEALMTRALPFNDRALARHRLLIRARAQPTPANIKAVLDAHAPPADEAVKLANIQFANVVLLAYGTFGRTEEAFDLLDYPTFERHLEWDILFRPEFAPVRRDRRFMAVAARVGFVKYWLSSGHWPDFCVSEELTYNCKEEAAKYG